MNTAERTIGQIDYAVRRRFALVKLLPKLKVAKENNIPNASELFPIVEKLFKDNQFLSPDYHYHDVAIGHSYSLVENEVELKKN